MAYATKTYYRSTYIGRPCAVDATLEAWLARASDDIDLETGFGFVYADLTVVQQTLVQKATCAQAENYIVNGDGIDIFNSVSIGSFSLSGGDKRESQKGICENANRFLIAAGLGFRGVPVCSRSHA